MKTVSKKHRSGGWFFC